MVIDSATYQQLEVLDRETGGDLLPALVELFVGGTSERLRQIGANLGAGAFEAVAAQAHSLRGSSSSLGASAVAALCTDLEKASTRHDAATCTALWLQLTDEVAAASRELTALQRRDAG